MISYRNEAGESIMITFMWGLAVGAVVSTAITGLWVSVIIQDRDAVIRELQIAIKEANK